MTDTEKLAELLRAKGSNGTLVAGVIRDLGLVKIPRERNAGWRYTWWQEPLVKVATVDIEQLKDMLFSGRFMMARNAEKKGFQMLWDHFRLGDNAAAIQGKEKTSPRYYAIMLEEYQTAKAKQSGNLHERMKLVNDFKDKLFGLLEPLFPFGSDVGSAAHHLFVAIMDLETEVSQYQVRKTGNGSTPP